MPNSKFSSVLHVRVLEFESKTRSLKRGYMDEDKVRSFAVVIEASMLIVALCISIALGFMFGPGIGFLSFGGFVMLFVIVIMVSYAREQRQVKAMEREVDR